jgi:hypothetical protein
MESAVLEQMAREYNVNAAQALDVLRQSRSILVLPQDDERFLSANALHCKGLLYYRTLYGETVKDNRDVYAPTPAGYALLSKRS